MYTRRIALGRLRRGFFVSPAAIWESEHKERRFKNPAYRNDLRTNEREGSVVKDGPPPEEPTLCAGYPFVLSKRTWVLPVAETDTIMVGTTSEVKDETQDDETGDCEYFDRTSKCIGKWEQLGSVDYPREPKLGLPIGTSAEHVDGNDDDDTYCHPDCIVHVRVPVIYQEGSRG